MEILSTEGKSSWNLENSAPNLLPALKMLAKLQG